MCLREAILTDLPRLHSKAEHFGSINIQDGTKAAAQALQRRDGL